MSEQEVRERIREIKERAESVEEFGSLSLESDQNQEYFYIDRDSNHDWANPMIETNSIDAARFIFGAFADVPFLLDLVEALQRDQQAREKPEPHPLTFRQVGDAIDKQPIFYVPEEQSEPSRWLSIRGTMIGYESQRTVFVDNANDPEERRIEWGRGFFYATEPEGEQK